MATHYFEVNNVRSKHSASPVGTDGTRAQISTTHSNYFQGTFTAAAALAVSNSLAHAMKLYSPTDIATLKTAVTAIAAAGSGLAEDTTTWQQRVGKGVWQITSGYNVGSNAAALTSAIAAQVDIDLV